MSDSRPLLSKPPLNLLVNPQVIREKKPWEVDLSSLLTAFLEILARAGYIDLRLCGSAALSSALIYRLKVETLFMFEKLRIAKRGEETEPPLILPLPFRYEMYSTSLDDLLAALEKILAEMALAHEKERPRPAVVEPEPFIELDQFITHIHDILVAFKDKILKAVQEKRGILFSEYIREMDAIGAVRSFILLLFAATDGVVKLEQVEDDIRITSAI